MPETTLTLPDRLLGSGATMFAGPGEITREYVDKMLLAALQEAQSAVLAAAIDVFLERGVTRATLEQIARAAGVTRGAIYWHFHDKQEVFTALERRANVPNEELGDRLKAGLASDPELDPLGELAGAIGEGLQSFEMHPERPRILTILWLRCEYSDDMLPVVARQRDADLALQKLFESVIGLASARGRLAPALSPEMAARALLLLVNGSVLDWLRAPGEFELTASTMRMVTGFLEAISAPKAPAAADEERWWPNFGSRIKPRMLAAIFPWRSQWQMQQRYEPKKPCIGRS